MAGHFNISMKRGGLPQTRLAWQNKQRFVYDPTPEDDSDSDLIVYEDGTTAFVSSNPALVLEILQAKDWELVHPAHVKAMGGAR